MKKILILSAFLALSNISPAQILQPWIYEKKATIQMFDDWVMPSRDDLASVLTVVSPAGYTAYFSSSEGTGGWAGTCVGYFASPLSGESHFGKTDYNYIWPVRYFETETDIYDVGDTGPAGGTIVYKEAEGEGAGEVYIEAAKQENITQRVWSNVNTGVILGTSTDRFYGETNSELIVNQPGHTNSGAKYCLDLVTYN